MTDRAPAAKVEFFENRSGSGDIRVINECRINGTRVLLAKEPGIQIHGVDNWDDPVMVTLTLFASEIHVGAAPETTMSAAE